MALGDGGGQGTAVRLLRRPVPASWPSLPLALALTAGAGAALVRAVVDARFLWQHPSSNDFGEYFLAGRIGLADGWAAVYDVHTYVAAARVFLGFPDAFANLPVVAWLAAPLTALPYRLALALWLLALAGAVLWVWRVAVPAGSRAIRAAHLAAWLASFPLAFAFLLGQLCVAVLALVVLHWWLLRSGRSVLAGVALGLAFVKPQMLFLVQVALLVSRRWRSAAACGATVLAIGGLCLLLLGPQGLAAYRESVAVELPTRFDALAAQMPGWFPMPPLQAAIACVALIPALAGGRERFELALPAAVLGSLLATPYLNPEDAAILFPCAWLVLRAEPARWVRAGMLLSYPAVALRNVTGPVPVLWVEAFWLVALAAIALRGAPRRTGRRDDQGARLDHTRRVRLPVGADALADREPAGGGGVQPGDDGRRWHDHGDRRLAGGPRLGDERAGADAGDLPAQVDRVAGAGPAGRDAGRRRAVAVHVELDLDHGGGHRAGAHPLAHDDDAGPGQDVGLRGAAGLEDVRPRGVADGDGAGRLLDDQRAGAELGDLPGDALRGPPRRSGRGLARLRLAGRGSRSAARGQREHGTSDDDDVAPHVPVPPH